MKNKNFLTKIYWNIQTFTFQMLQECSSWVLRNGAVEMFFLTATRNMFCCVVGVYLLQFCVV